VWLADVEAIMAAGKRKSRYGDVLQKPIQLQRPELGLWLHKDEMRRQSERAWLERFDSLKAHYGIGAEDPESWQKLALCLISDHERGRLGVFLKSYGSEVKDPRYWQGLAICLARDHVPGLTMLPPKPGRPGEWSIERAQEFVRLTDDDLKKNGPGLPRRTLSRAVRNAAKTMGVHLTRAGAQKSGGTLENLYRRSKEMISRSKEMIRLAATGTPLGVPKRLDGSQ
jgi:hypothetical protein